MPELPEVETVVRTLRNRLTGASIKGVTVRHAGIIRCADAPLPAALPGLMIAAVRRRGKRIEIDLSDGRVLRFHLGMTGQLRLQKPAEPAPVHTHLVLHLAGEGDDVSELRFADARRIGGVWLLRREQASCEDLGPEACDISAAVLARRLARTRRPVKTVLLDQSVIAGLGNIYADESLHAAGIHPRAPANRLSPAQIARLAAAIRRIVHLAIRHRGSSVRDYVDGDGLPGTFQKLHRVYGRENQPCRRCGTPVKRIVLGGRSAHFCPKCQPSHRRCATTAPPGSRGVNP